MMPLSRAIELDAHAAADRAFHRGLALGIPLGFVLTCVAGAFAWWFWSVP